MTESTPSGDAPGFAPPGDSPDFAPPDASPSFPPPAGPAVGGAARDSRPHRRSWFSRTPRTPRSARTPRASRPRTRRRGRLATALTAAAAVCVLVVALAVTRPWDVQVTHVAPPLPDLASTPRPAWTVSLGDGVWAGRVLDPGRTHPRLADRILIDSLDSDGHLTAVNTETGAVAWRSPQLYDARCVLGHPTAVACLVNGQITLYDVKDGRKRDSFAAPAAVTGLAATDAAVFALSYDQTVKSPVTLRRLGWNGSVAWTREIAPAGDYLADREGPALTLDGDRIAVTAQGPGGVSDARGLVVKTSDGAPVVAPGSYSFAATGELALTRDDLTTQLFDRDGHPGVSLGGTLLPLAMDAARADAPLVAATEDGVTRFAPNGTPQWTSTDVSLPSAACGSAVLQAMDGRVTAVDAASGAKLWEASGGMDEPRLTCDGPRVVATFDSDAAPDPSDHPAAVAYDLRSGDVVWQVAGLHRVFTTSRGIVDAEAGSATLYR